MFDSSLFIIYVVERLDFFTNLFRGRMDAFFISGTKTTIIVTVSASDKWQIFDSFNYV